MVYIWIKNALVNVANSITVTKFARWSGNSWSFLNSVDIDTSFKGCLATSKSATIVGLQKCVAIWMGSGCKFFSSQLFDVCQWQETFQQFTLSTAFPNLHKTSPYAQPRHKQFSCARSALQSMKRSTGKRHIKTMLLCPRYCLQAKEFTHQDWTAI